MHYPDLTPEEETALFNTPESTGDRAAATARGAEFFSRHPQFAGYALQSYLRRERIGLEDLCERWDAKEDQLNQLALCLLPRADHWEEDLAALARVAGLEVAQLRVMFR